MKVAPEQESMEPNYGKDAYHDMPDGWRLHSETWLPSEAPVAVLLFSPGWMECTVSLGVRRLAHQCKKRGLIFVTYDPHWHGLSLEKAGVKKPEKQRGLCEGVHKITDHLVEMAKIVLAEHTLPLITMGHSLSGCGALSATAGIARACEAAGQKYVCNVLLEPFLEFKLCPCDCCCTHVCLCFCCCGSCCMPAPGGIAAINPKGSVGEQRQATRMYIHNYLVTALSGVSGMPTAAALPDLMDKAPVRIFLGTKGDAPQTWPKLVQAKYKGDIQWLEGAIHDMLSVDPKNAEHIDAIFSYIDEMLSR